MHGRLGLLITMNRLIVVTGTWVRAPLEALHPLFNPLAPNWPWQLFPFRSDSSSTLPNQISTGANISLNTQSLLQSHRMHWHSSFPPSFRHSFHTCPRLPFSPTHNELSTSYPPETPPTSPFFLTVPGIFGPPKEKTWVWPPSLAFPLLRLHSPTHINCSCTFFILVYLLLRRRLALSLDFTTFQYLF